MKQSISLSQSQRLNLTPQLQQAIRILQLSATELQMEVEDFLMANPLASQDNEEYQSDSPESDDSEYDTQVSDDIPEELHIDVDWSLIEEDWQPTQAMTANEVPWQNIGRTEYNMTDLLLNQVKEYVVSNQIEQIIQQLVHCLDDKGFLSETDEQLIEYVRVDGQEVSNEAIAYARKQLQGFDPVGFGAIDALDYSFIQLCELPDQEGLMEALLLLKEGLVCNQTLEKRQIKKLTELSDYQIEKGIELLSGLFRYPAQALNIGSDQYIVPELLVYSEQGRYQVKLNEEVVPKVGINPFYRSMIKTIKQQTEQKYLKQQLNDAQDFIKNIHNRFHTIHRVAEKIVEKQQEFLQKGPKFMKPLTLNAIAEDLSMHESTVSRATANKFMATPHGVHELKYFFSSHVENEKGLYVSATAIRSHIKDFVEQENPKKPLSDQALCEQLKECHGIKIARRTVAKYRESMHILSSSQRKKRI